MFMSSRLRTAAQAGFTLIELLVTVAVIAVGLLGLGKLQASALAASQVSRTRAIMTFQAEALAGAMRANPGYWAVTTGTLPNLSVATGAVTDVAGTMAPRNTATDFSCANLDTTHKCTPPNLAYYDTHNWATAFNAQFPSAIAAVSCNTTNGPTSCDIRLSWNEHYVAMNRTTANGVTSAAAAASSALGNTLVLHVQP